jgi:hypothetical protein
VVVVATMFLALAAPATAADRLTATLDGQRIRIDRVGELNCHDFDFPVIRCFSSGTRLATDIASHVAPADGASLLLTGYVTVYEHAAYQGASIALSVDQPYLSSIGWNDRISSFKSFGANGHFREHSPAGGFLYAYGSTTQISSLGAVNDTFSAFSIN